VSALRQLVRNVLRGRRPEVREIPAAAPPQTRLTHVPETTPVAARADAWQGPRLTMVLPSINPEHYFGGVHTAVELYREMYRKFPASRLVILDSPPRPEALAILPDHSLVASDEASNVQRQIVPYSDRYNKTLPVAAGDQWLATAWWTAYAAQRLAAWQAHEFGALDRIAYLIQDYEPGFYPWSSQYALALSTYRVDRDIAVFNTGLLSDYFCAQGFAYRRSFVFEPALNPVMRPALEAMRASKSPRNRRIVVYARPSTPRNAFELLCEGLRMWGRQDPAAQSWELLAPGELTQDIDLGPFRLRAVGKLGIEEYANLLCTSAIGVSFMISPHPSYPPLEMAAFGMTVVTNGFANKNLSLISPNIRSLAVLSPEELAAALSQECAAWEDRAMQPEALAPPGHAFLSSDGLKAVAVRVGEVLLSGVTAGVARRPSRDSGVGPDRPGWADDARVPKEIRQTWIRDGLVVLPGLVSEERAARHCELVSEVRAAVPNGRDEYGLGDRIGQLHQKIPELLDTLPMDALRNLLRWALDDEPLLFASLNFDRGTQQEAHVDLIYFCTHPLYSMAGVWIALEDVRMEAGPAFYHVGSHRWTFDFIEEKASDSRRAEDPLAPADVIQTRGNAWLARLANRAREVGSTAQPILLRRGDVAIWHAKLAHGGLPRTAPDLSRKSVVYHFIGARSRLYSFEEFFSYSRSELLKRPGVVVPEEKRGGVRYQRHPYFVTYDGGRELVHPLNV